MSDFYSDDTYNPRTGKLHRALWLDSYFGKRRYGVRFDGEDHVYRTEQIRTVREAEQSGEAQ
jgi:hypothetical protein